MTVKVPAEFKCTKTGDIMEFPVVNLCGHNFEVQVFNDLDAARPKECCPACKAPLCQMFPAVQQDLNRALDDISRSFARVWAKVQRLAKAC